MSWVEIYFKERHEGASMIQEKILEILQKSKLTINKTLRKNLIDIFFWMIVVAIMLKPESFEYLGWIKLDKALDLCKIIVVSGSVIAYFFSDKKHNIVIFAVAHKLLAVIVTAMLNGDIKMALIFALNAFFFTAIVYWGCDNKNIICALYYVLTIFLIVNFISIILYPSGMYRTQEIGWEKNWFLGWKTILPLYIIPESALAFLFYHNTRKKRHIIIFLLSVSQPFMEGSAGAVISAIVLLTGFLVSILNIAVARYFFNICSIFVGYTLASYLLVIVNITEKMGKSLFVLFGKDGTLTSRTTVLWPINLQAFLNRPLFGYGYLKQENFINILGGHRAHNIFLGILISSGTIGLIVFIAFILYLHKGTKKYMGTRAYGFCASCILALFTAGLIEAYDNIGVAGIIFVMIYFLPLLFENDGNEVRRNKSDPIKMQ